MHNITEKEEQRSSNQQAVKFTGQYGEYWLLCISNLLLIICTLGIYSFWAIPKVKRYLHQQTSIGGYQFNFHATAKHYFISFVYVLLFLLGYGLSIAIHPFLFLIYLLVAIGCLPLLLVRSYRFHAHMTSLNGSRFSFQGPVSRAYWVIGAAPILIIIAAWFTLVVINALFIRTALTSVVLLSVMVCLDFLIIMLALAIIQTLALNYYINHHYFNQQKFIAAVKLSKLLVINSIAAIIPVLLILVLGALFMNQVIEFIYTLSYARSGYHTADSQSAMIMAIVSFYLIILVFLITIIAVKTVLLRNYLFSITTLGQLQFKSTFTFASFILLLLSNIAIVICSLGLAAPIASIRAYRYFADNTIIIGQVTLPPANDADNGQETNTDMVAEAIIASI